MTNDDAPLKDAHDHLKAAIAEMKDSGNEPPMSIYKAMHALTHALTEANERIHYAEGTAALAMKHRDEAETRLAEAKIAIEAPTKEEITLHAQLVEARKTLERITTAQHLSRSAMQQIAGDAVRAISVTGEEGKK